MNVEIINVGTELLLGEIVNTNATYLQKMCKELGFDVYFQQTVGDNPDRVKQALDVAFSRGADCVITTGGLGPTQDDLTKEIATDYLGLNLVYDKEQAATVMAKMLFLTKGQEVTSNNLKQAFFPEGAHILENAVGTANGCIMKSGGRMIINLPGPPKELRYLVDSQLKDYLKQYRQARIYTKDIHTLGIGESKVAHILEDIINNQNGVSIALYASEISVRVRLGYKALTKEEAYGHIAKIEQEIIAKLKDNVVENLDLRKYIYDHIPPYTINLPEDCELFIKPIGPVHGNDLVVNITKKEYPLGEELKLDIFNQGEKFITKIRYLGHSSYSKEKIEHRILEAIAKIL